MGILLRKIQLTKHKIHSLAKLFWPIYYFCSYHYLLWHFQFVTFADVIRAFDGGDVVN